MEIDDLKNAWNELGEKSNPKTLSNRTGLKFDSKPFRSKLSKVLIPEIIGGIICFFGASYIVLYFGRLDTFFLRSLGLVTVLLFLVLPIVSITLLFQMNKLGDLSRSYAETIKKFTKHEIRFKVFQKITIGLSFILLIATVVLLSKILNGRHVLSDKYISAAIYAAGFLFTYFFSRWVWRYYVGSLNKASELLRDIDS